MYNIYLLRYVSYLEIKEDIDAFCVLIICRKKKRVEVYCDSKAGLFTNKFCRNQVKLIMLNQRPEPFHDKFYSFLDSSKLSKD